MRLKRRGEATGASEIKNTDMVGYRVPSIGSLRRRTYSLDRFNAGKSDGNRKSASLKERAHGPADDDRDHTAGAVAAGVGDVVYVGWVHTHPAGAGDYRDINSGDTGATADSVRIALVNENKSSGRRTGAGVFVFEEGKFEVFLCRLAAGATKSVSLVRFQLVQFPGIRAPLIF